jgi:hypothetical protein
MGSALRAHEFENIFLPIEKLLCGIREMEEGQICNIEYILNKL